MRETSGLISHGQKEQTVSHADTRGMLLVKFEHTSREEITRISLNPRELETPRAVSDNASLALMMSASGNSRLHPLFTAYFFRDLARSAVLANGSLRFLPKQRKHAIRFIRAVITETYTHCNIFTVAYERYSHVHFIIL